MTSRIHVLRLPEIHRSSPDETITKPDGTRVQYCLFDEYEVHYNELPPGVRQAWHHHERVEETICVTDGQVTLRWTDGDEYRATTLDQGDLVRLGTAPHMLENQTTSTARFVVIKTVPSGGGGHQQTFLTDKFLDYPPGSPA